MKILALDLGKFNTMCCFFDSKSKKHSFLNASTTREELTVVLKKRKIDLVVMEACGPSGWINGLAQILGHKTIVCSTNEDAWRWTNVKRKTDKDDALKLARMASMNELHPVHMPSETHREFRSLVKYRKTLDQRINKMKCTIRAWFVNRGISIDRGEKAWCTGRALIDSYRKPLAECSPNELWKGQLDIELTQLDTLTQHLQTVVRQLEAIGKNDARIQRIRTIPGVGPRTAEILVACIDDPHRFKNGRQVSAYFGLVPRQYQSGETDRAWTDSAWSQKSLPPSRPKECVSRTEGSSLLNEAHGEPQPITESETNQDALNRAWITVGTQPVSEQVQKSEMRSHLE